MSIAIGIAGGHRKTQAIVLESKRVREFCDLDIPLNLHNFSKLEVRSNLRRILDSLANLIQVDCVEMVDRRAYSIVLSIPGVSTPDDVQAGKNLFPSMGLTNTEKVQIIDDTWSGLLAGLVQERGICAFSGSGASVYFAHEGFRLGKDFKLDGFGVIIGDHGGGFRMAIRLIEEIGREFDRGNVHALVAKLKTVESQLSAPAGLQRWFDSLTTTSLDGSWRQRVALLARVVTAAAAGPTPDPTAVSIVKQSARGLAETIMIGLERFGDACQNLPITCQGGMFRYSELYADEARRIVAEAYPNNPIDIGLYHPVVGAALMAQTGATTPKLPDRSTTEQILASIFEHPEAKVRCPIRATADRLFG